MMATTAFILLWCGVGVPFGRMAWAITGEAKRPPHRPPMPVGWRLASVAAACLAWPAIVLLGVAYAIKGGDR